MSKTGYVYTLSDPETEEPKYVGATKDPHQRLYGHLNGATNEDVSEWIDTLSDEGKEPVMNLVRVAPLEELSEHEQEVIAELVDSWNLLNKKHESHYSHRRSVENENRDNNLYETFGDDEFAELKGVKGDRTWREAIAEEFGVDTE